MIKAEKYIIQQWAQAENDIEDAKSGKKKSKNGEKKSMKAQVKKNVNLRDCRYAVSALKCTHGVTTQSQITTLF